MKKTIMTLMLLVFGIVAGLLIAETALRIAGISYPKFQTIDNTLGYVNNPGIKGWFTDEGRGYVEFNSQGIRGPEYSEKKPDGVYRIAVLGDSYTSAMQVNREDSFPAIIEKKLSSCGRLAGKKVEVINFGVSGYGTAQELIMLRERVLKYSPDMVVLAFLSGNDLSDNSPQLDDTEIPRPYFRLVSGKLIIDNSFRNSEYHVSRHNWKRRIYDYVLARSRLLQVAARVKHVRMLENNKDRLLSKNKNNNKAYMLNDNIYSPPTTPEMTEAWLVTEKLIQEISIESAMNKAQFLLVTLTNPGQASPKPDNANNDSANKVDLLYPEKRLSSFAKANNIDILTLAEPFRNYAQSKNVYLHGFGKDIGAGHWNEKGHALAGELIAQKICERL